MKAIYIMSAALIFSIMLISCSTSEESKISNAPLANARWLLKYVDDKKVMTPEGGKEAYMLLKSDTLQVQGSGGCNNFFGTYTKEGSVLKFGPVVRTEMYCEGRMQVEDAFMKALEKTNRFKIKGEVLYLYENRNLLARLEADSIR
jgi:heat shock protein HslJ